MGSSTQRDVAESSRVFWYSSTKYKNNYNIDSTLTTQTQLRTVWENTKQNINSGLPVTEESQGKGTLVVLSGYKLPRNAFECYTGCRQHCLVIGFHNSHWEITEIPTNYILISNTWNFKMKMKRLIKTSENFASTYIFKINLCFPTFQ